MRRQKEVNKRRQRRRFHVRERVRGSAERPRLSVHRSLMHIECQVIDDVGGRTIVAASTKEKALGEVIRYGGNKYAAAAIGRTIAQRAIAVGIKEVRFDRGDSRYHGRVASLADAAREAGLVF